MYIAKNIDVVQFDLKQGQTEYYFPKNVSWANKKVDKIIVYDCYGTRFSLTETSPINGATLTKLYLLDYGGNTIYMDLYDTDNNTIVQKVALGQISSLNNNPLYVNNTVSLELSKLYFSTPVTEDASLLVYVFFDGEEQEELPPINKSITIGFSVPAGGKVSFQDLVDNYITLQPNKVKGLIAMYMSVKLQGGGRSAGFITLRDKAGKRVFNHVPTMFMRNNVNMGEQFGELVYGFTTQTNTFRFAPMDVDMLNSFITNRQSEDEQYTITFLY